MSRILIRAAATTAAAALAALAVAAPASAATDESFGPQSQVVCSGSLDGGQACITASAAPPNRVYGYVLLDQGRTFAGVLLTLMGCDDAGRCVPVVTKTAADVNALSTGTVAFDPAHRYYQVNASWVDDQQHLHTGVVASLHRG
ncbi:hypothetical protein [Pseudonocardia sp. GCM10023141]|uniref:hypothetical protein n=1 Tax=Pseudonocardia sp. GCM10023141 TaxID=3252653 RepID=UPI00361F380F